MSRSMRTVRTVVTSAARRYASAPWLRERSRKPDLLHVASRQRVFEAADLVDTPSGKLASARLSEDGVMIEVQYEDGVEDTLNCDAVMKEITDRFCLETDVGNGVFEPVALNSPEEVMWDKDGGFKFSAEKVFVYDELAAEGEHNPAMTAFLTALFRYGAVIVKNVPRGLANYEAFLTSFGTVRATNWGKWFEVVAKPAEKTADGSTASMADAAYSSLGIPLHTDGPYNMSPLQYQVLQCIKQSPTGGESSLADGRAAVAALRANDPNAFDLLTRTPVRFRYYDAHNDLLTERPMITLEKDGSIGDIFFSGRLDASPVCASLEESDAFYKAKQKLLSEMYHPERMVSFKLEENDMLIFRNTRILHGRKEFPAQEESAGGQSPSEDDTPEGCEMNLATVTRYLRGCYMEDIDSKYRVHLRQTRVRSSLTRQARHMSSGRTASFVHLADSTPEDVRLMTELYSDACTGTRLADRALGIYQLLCHAPADGHRGTGPKMLGITDTHLGAGVDLYEHGLQTATRCLRDGCSEEVVVAGLLHDLGELLSPSNHGEFTAALLRPFVSPHVSWMLEHHEVFQMYYYAHKSTTPGDRNARDVYKNKSNDQLASYGIKPTPGIDLFDFTVDWCDKYDQTSFDPSYSSMDLEEFRPMVRRVFQRQAYWHSPQHPKKGAVTGVKDA
eukprot:Hpha_TRINITY_DN11054_c0_g1::TRINITY_DN11054_c0_g1_i1::g.92987::m.92987